jgi:hypothetical protein
MSAPRSKIKAFAATAVVTQNIVITAAAGSIPASAHEVTIPHSGKMESAAASDARSRLKLALTELSSEEKLSLSAARIRPMGESEFSKLQIAEKCTLTCVCGTTRCARTGTDWCAHTGGARRSKPRSSG